MGRRRASAVLHGRGNTYLRRMLIHGARAVAAAATVNAGAHEAYLKGWYFLNSRTRTACERESAIFRSRSAWSQNMPTLTVHWLSHIICMYSESIRAIERSVSIAGENASIQQGRQAYIYAVAGKRKEAKAIATRLGARSMRQYVPEYYLAATCVALGERDHAFQFLQMGYIHRDFMLPFLRSDPIWDAIREDERFRALAAQMNFPGKTSIQAATGAP